MAERVLVIKNRLLEDRFYYKRNGSLITDHADEIIHTITANYTFLPRDQAENDYHHKQIIPYVIIRHNNKLLLLQRTAEQTEKRLHNKYSLGIGGHINPFPEMSRDEIIGHGLYRELNEEIHLKDPGQLEFIGIINDDSNSVGKVHLGLLYVLSSLSSDYNILEAEKMTARWVLKEELIGYYDYLETWSQIVLDYYIIPNRYENESKRKNNTGA